MLSPDEAFQALAKIPGLTVLRSEPLSRHTRFGIGGPADLFAEAAAQDAFLGAVDTARTAGLPLVVIGEGTNLVVADEGFRGVALRFKGAATEVRDAQVRVEAGASLQAVVDSTIEAGLRGLETLAGIPGSAGAAVYGNVGAYGHSISEVVRGVSFFDGASIREFGNAECEFQYRESVFKRRREWLVLSAELGLVPASPAELRAIADEIVTRRNAKFPPDMKCAGSIFKNLLLADLPAVAAASVPANVVREGKVPAAWFLEQCGAKGRAKGAIHVAVYHANLIYNAGGGTSRDLRELIADLKSLVQARFAVQLEEEVQYVGFCEN